MSCRKGIYNLFEDESADNPYKNKDKGSFSLSFI